MRRRVGDVPGRGAMALALLLAVPLWGVACGPDEEGEPPPVPEASGPDPFADAPEFGYAGPVGERRAELEARTDEAGDPGDLELTHETEEDWAILRATVEWALEQGLHELPAGEIMAIVGTTFVGTPYLPQTLELPGPEALVVNLRALDCVTFVENMLAVAHLLRSPELESLLEEEDALRERYREILTRIRYRQGDLNGYPSRLHYFSEWISDAEEKGLAADMTEELGGVPDTREIHFMSSNVEAYPKLLEEPEFVDVIQETEEELNRRTRFRISQDEVAAVEDGIQNGDIIATTSTVDGLDVAHTGIALRHRGRIHIIHATLVGENVEISELPLAERLQRLDAQDGIMVARPADPLEGGGGG